MEQQITLDGNVTMAINFAMQQNYVPIIRSILVNNQTEKKYENLTLKVNFDPDFAKEYTYSIAGIEPGQMVEISPVLIKLRTEYLFSLTEKIVGTITMELLCDGELLASYDKEIELLAYDQWSGLFLMPEIIAAFVTPNHPLIAKVIKDASEWLMKWTGHALFTGYQTNNPNHVKLQMGAIYMALKMQNITYNNPLASYEVIGQRIRLSHIVLQQKQGTCLDLAILYASCLEAIGLHPLLFFKKGHAWAGAWVEEQTFADCMVDDVSAIEKRVVEGAEELLLVECTDYVGGKEVAFDKALCHGKNHLKAAEEFQGVVDIIRSRGSGIRPIPLRLETEDMKEDVELEDRVAVYENAPSTLDNSLLGRVTEGSTNRLTKQKMWERKLLDFSLRNMLLNFRVTKNSVQLMTADLGKLEDKLSEGKEFQILELPNEWTSSMRDSKMFEIETEKNLIESIADEEFKSNRIRTFLDEEALEKNLKGLYRSAKMSLEENGSNTLFLALGFLRWYESDVSEKARYAPIVLIPVEIVRSIRKRGYVLRSRQEDPQINITLLEYLRQDYGITIEGLDPLPEDEHGIDLKFVYYTIQQAILTKKRWNVEQMAFIGLFSFGQFVMWNDLHSRMAEIEQNKVVASLIQGKMSWIPEGQSITADKMDASYEVKDLAIPVSADSSQMVAITTAGEGESFVLHGPPGTGKSQTITNMIANALYQGKSVLFVAEKMAALNVVQKRLADIGLDPFCLELHSNKSNKSTVLGELEKALAVGRIQSSEEYEQTAARICKLKEELNGIVEAIHQRREFGGSLYDAIEQYSKNQKYKGKLNFDQIMIQHLTKEEMEDRFEIIREYAVISKQIGCYEKHPLKEYQGTEYSMELREQMQQSLIGLLDGFTEMKNDASQLLHWIGAKEQSTRLFLMIPEIIEAATRKGMVLLSLIRNREFTTTYDRLLQLIQVGKDYQLLQEEVIRQFDIQVLNYPVEEARMRWRQAETSWFLPKMMGQKKLLKEMMLYAKNPREITKSTIGIAYEKLALMRELKKIIEDTPKATIDLLETLFQGVSTDWNQVEEAVEKAKVIVEAIQRLPSMDWDKAVQAISDTRDFGTLLACARSVQNYWNNLNVFLSYHRIQVEEPAEGQDEFSQLYDILIRYQQNLDLLRDKIIWNQVDEKVRNHGLKPVSDAYREGKLDYNEMEAATSCNLYYQLILTIIGTDPRLARFHGKHYNDLIQQFEEMLERHRRLTIQELIAKLSAKIPNANSVSLNTSELGILKKAIKNNGRMMSLRRLFDQIPTLLRRLCPCMLMSPISVAQYIDPSFPKFDLVIFDEASQLPTCEAVGTIARGENVVIVGDPKQLPPTNFFATNYVDEENSEKEDLESLLDDCLAITMPQESLKWHYRSRHESLIAYSNLRYYDNKLYTFPSPRDLVSEVKMVHLEGYYDKGKTKHNLAEAHAIVDEIMRRMQDETLRHDSIGVVTFNSSQQNLIDDLLMEAMKNHPEIEEFDRASNEPIFIKNLENVQGDERDVILFSIGYGPDKKGEVSMNFGPLNRDGGWRRLNVAISRARKQMIVYSVLRPEQIDLSRTRSQGVADLKGFLEFAERGKNMLVQRANQSVQQEDYVVEEVAAAIKEQGFEARSNIGCSAYKVDLAIVNPKEPESYLLGILIDGRNCRQASTARDRFVLQPSVLEGLGWSIVRIWTLDWLDDKKRVLDEIMKVIKKAQENKIEMKPEREVIEKPMLYASEIYAKNSTVEEPKSRAREYDSYPVRVLGTSENFYLPQTMPLIRALIKEILEVESPVSRKAVMKKVCSAWGITRAGSKVEAIFEDALLHVTHRVTKDEDRCFLWKGNRATNRYECYRVADQMGNRRSFDEIPSQEILVAMREVLVEQVSLTRSDLIKETAKKFGYTRLSSGIEACIDYVVNEAMEQETMTQLENGNLILPE